MCVDPPFQSESARVGQYATALGIPFVSIDCPYQRALAREAAVVIISGEFRAREYPGAQLAELFSEYQARAHGLVVFTVGHEAVWYGRRGEKSRRFRPYRVKVVDSAGAGDAFRAGVIHGLLKRWGDADIMRYASAVAGLVCASLPGVLKSPSHAAVLRFIQSQVRANKS